MPSVILCGDRNWTDFRAIKARLASLKILYGSSLTVICGGARGADKLAAIACRVLGIQYKEIEAVWVPNWKIKGLNPGHERNIKMLDRMLSSDPLGTYAFKDPFGEIPSRGGTEHMCRITREARLPASLLSYGKWRELP